MKVIFDNNLFTIKKKWSYLLERYHILNDYATFTIGIQVRNFAVYAI